MKTLDEIGIHFQTDKASQFSRTYAKPHDYLRHLERFFEPIRYNPIKLVEIGCGGGESVRMWLEYFSQGHIYSVDCVSNTNPWNTRDSGIHERYTFIPGDQSKPVFWSSFIKMHGGDWDVVIDDGSHVASDTLTTFNALWPNVKSGGLYEIEDIASAPNTDQWLRQSLGPLHQNRSECDSIYFSHELCIMVKR